MAWLCGETEEARDSEKRRAGVGGCGRAGGSGTSGEDDSDDERAAEGENSRWVGKRRMEMGWLRK